VRKLVDEGKRDRQRESFAGERKTVFFALINCFVINDVAHFFQGSKSSTTFSLVFFPLCAFARRASSSTGAFLVAEIKKFTKSFGIICSLWMIIN